jgi:hypothetical protein
MLSHTYLVLATQSANLLAKHLASKKRNCCNDRQLKLHDRKRITELLPLSVRMMV